MSRTKSSGRWLKEHFSDTYVKEAQKQGYRSRAAFKLLEINTKDKLLKTGMTVVDLGAAPGGWSQVAAELLGPKGHIVALDILAMPPIEGVEFIEGDFTEPAVLEQLHQTLGGRAVDLVICDIAPNISGVASVDQPRCMYLVELALEFVRTTLKPKGNYLVKVFQGTGFETYLKDMRTVFNKVIIRKPKASRDRSPEIYLIGLNKR
jgi:23S rRNA (uridine2552-2'-O)-methyltransferase